jgi:hypothetical protein
MNVGLVPARSSGLSRRRRRPRRRPVRGLHVQHRPLSWTRATSPRGVVRLAARRAPLRDEGLLPARRRPRVRDVETVASWADIRGSPDTALTFPPRRRGFGYFGYAKTSVFQPLLHSRAPRFELGTSSPPDFSVDWRTFRRSGWTASPRPPSRRRPCRAGDYEVTRVASACVALRGRCMPRRQTPMCRRRPRHSSRRAGSPT